MEIVARGAIIALVGILAADFFITEQYGKQLWLLLGLGPAIYGVARRTYPEAAEEKQPGQTQARALRPVPAHAVARGRWD
jgi:F0F1-type ATP synthase assembly protein I